MEGGRSLRSIIDYFIVKKALRPGVADVRVIRGAELGSHHFLVLMKVCLKLRKPRRVTSVFGQKLRVNRLTEKSTKRTFQQELRHSFRQMRCKREDGIEKMWQEFKESITEVTAKVVGRSKNRRVRKATSWSNNEVEQTVKKKKVMYKKALGEKSERGCEEYKTAKREAKHVVREAKEADWVRCGKQMQKSFL